MPNQTISLREKREARRREAGQMFRRGSTQAGVARKFRVSPAAACKWHAAWEADGMSGLDSKGPSGFASALDHKKKRKFKQAVLRGPLRQGYNTDLWTLNRLAAVLKKTTKLSFGPTRTWQVVRELGFTPQKPSLKDVERDEKAIADWKTRRLPGLKKMGGQTWILSGI
jgi:transposase